jgi:hypothetical protein
VAAGATDKSSVDAFLNGEIHAHELPWLAWRIWSDGFRAGCERMQAKVDRVNRDADIYYDLAFNGDEARKRHEATVRHYEMVQARKRAGEKAGAA